MKLKITLALGLLYFGSALGLPAIGHCESLNPDFVCGDYEVIGRLRHLGPASDVLEFYPGTTRRFELILRRVDADDEITRNKQIVRFKLRITVPGKNNEGKTSEAIGRPISPLRLASPKDALSSPITLLSKGNCSP
jgi:hypothetical protein